LSFKNPNLEKTVFKYAFRRLVRLSLKLALIALVAVIALGIWGYLSYPRVRDAALAEEKEFWRQADALSLEDRSALVNFVERTEQLPRVLPWWQYDEDVCSITAVKYLNLFTGIKLVHSAAWKVRTTGLNGRKLTTVWDESDQYSKDSRLALETEEQLINKVGRFPFETNKVYLMGMRWKGTRWSEVIKAEGLDVNSHLVLVIRGRAIHYHHRDAGDPIHFESVEELLADGTMLPVWIAETHEKSRTHPPSKKLVVSEFQLPQVEQELTFEQRVMAYSTIQKWLVFPGAIRFLPVNLSKRMDTFVEKSVLQRVRNGYDMYPRLNTEEK